MGLDRVDLVGHSFGGGVAQWMLLQHRARIRRLALVSAGGLGREVGWALRLASVPYMVEHFGQPFMAHGTRLALNAAGGAYDAADIAEARARMGCTPGTARAFSRSVRDVIDWRGQNRHFLHRAHEVADLPPLALFWGDADPLIPIKHALESFALIDGATLTRFANAGHFPHRQEPERFVRELEAFLDAPVVAGNQVRDTEVEAYRARHRASLAPRHGRRFRISRLARRERRRSSAAAWGGSARRRW